MVSSVTRWFHALAAFAERDDHATSARQSRAPADIADRPTRASHTSASPCHLCASKACTLTLSNRACVNSVCEPVVKSCRRVPTAMTRSASRAPSLAAGEPVTPTAPTFSG